MKEYLAQIQRNNKPGENLKEMLTRKQCPKCKGNIYSSVDYYGRYEQCLQCGFTSDLDIVDNHKVKGIPNKEKSALV